MRNALELYANRHGGYSSDQNRGIPSEAEQYVESGDWPLSVWVGILHFFAFSRVNDFDYYSAVYFCVEDPCCLHNSRPIHHSGYCINCNQD